MNHLYDFNGLEEYLRGRFPGIPMLECAPMSKYTTFRIGGEADALIIPRNDDELLGAIAAADRLNIPVTVIGNGSNLLVRDGGIRGLVIRIAAQAHSGASAVGALWDIVIDGECMSVGAGASLSAAAQAAAKAGLSGMEPLSGIPGTVGGAALMNAGAYEQEMSRVVSSVEAIRRADSSRFGKAAYSGDALAYRYRGSGMMDDGAIITRVNVALRSDYPSKIAERMADYTQRRRSKQPLSEPSAGSFFKRPPGYFAGKLIEDSGLKGFSIGGAMISPMHAGFVVNKGGATARDVINLMNETVERVRQGFGVTLEPEVRIIGEDAAP